MKTYCYSTDPEMFHNDVEAMNRHAANCHARSMHPDQKVYVGEKRTLDPSTWVDANDILDQLACRAMDEAGDVAEGWPDVSADQVSELSERLRMCVSEWIKETGNTPQFYAVDNVAEARGPELDQRKDGE